MSQEYRFGRIVVRLESGDLFQAPGEAMVIPVGQDLTFTTRLGQGLADRMGAQALEKAVERLRPAQAGQVLVLRPGRRGLTRHVLLAVVAGRRAVLGMAVRQIGEKATDLAFSQVALPALGGGEMGLAPEVAASEVIESIDRMGSELDRDLVLHFAFIDVPYLTAYRDQAARSAEIASGPRKEPRPGGAGPRFVVRTGDLFAPSGPDFYLVHAEGGRLGEAATEADRWSGGLVAKALARTVYALEESGEVAERAEGGDFQGRPGEFRVAASRRAHGSKVRPGLLLLGLGDRNGLTAEVVRGAHRVLGKSLQSLGFVAGGVLATTVPRPRLHWEWDDFAREMVLGLLEGIAESPEAAPREIRIHTRQAELADALARGVSVAEAEFASRAKAPAGAGRLGPGAPVGKYEILDGGPVEFRARDGYLGRAVLLQPIDIGSAQDRSRFLEIAQAASSVRHECFAALLDLFETDGRFYVVREAMDAAPPHEPLAAPAIVRAGRAVVEVVREFHGRGIAVLSSLRLGFTPEGRPILNLVPGRGAGGAEPASDYQSLGRLLAELSSGTAGLPGLFAALVEDLSEGRLADPDRVLAALDAISSELEPGREEGSSKFRHYVEVRYPAPIARAFWRLRGKDDPVAQCAELGTVLEEWLSLQAALAVKDWILSGAGALPDPVVELLLHGAPTSGRLCGVARTCFEGLAGRTDLLPAIGDLWRDKAFQGRVGRAIELRNQLHDENKGRAASELKPHLVRLLRETEFLAASLLLVPHSVESQAGLKTVSASLWRGQDQVAPRVRFETDADLECQAPYFALAPGEPMLPLDPFLGWGRCETCGEDRLWTWGGASGGSLARTALGCGHEKRDREALRRLKLELGTGMPDRPLVRPGRFLLLDDAAPMPHRRPEGEKIGRYAVRAFLARGGMADIYEVEEPATRARRAMKLLSYELARAWDLVARLKQEYAVLQRIESDSVVKVLEFGEDRGDHFIVLELAEGWPAAGGEVARDLSMLPLPLPWAEAVRLGIGISDGLHAIHRAGVVHRDLKPSNVLLFPPDRVKVADLGVARGRISATLTLTGLAVGTAEYMAPEQAEETSERRVDHRADLYSLGVVLFELLSGEVPFRAASPLATAMLHLRAAPPPLGDRASGVPAPLARLVARLLEKDPAARPASALEVRIELEQARG